MLFFHTLKINATKTTLDHTDVTQSFVPQRKEQKSPYFCLTSLCVLHCVLQEEVRAQMPRYHCKVPSAGQAHVTSPPVAPMGGVLPPQQGIPAQQPGVRHPMQGPFGALPQGLPGYVPGGMPPYGQAPPMVPPYQAAPPRPAIGMRPPVMSPGGRY